VRFGVATLALAAFAAGLTYQRGWWGSYEHRLAASVNHSDCKRVTSTRDGWGGDDMRALNEHTRQRFAAFCEELGPMVTWLRFRSAADMKRALAVTSSGPGTTLGSETVCVSDARAEVVVFDDVSRARASSLCGARDGRVVHRERVR
jgi:hypothetical protein